MNDRPTFHRAPWGTSAELVPGLWRVRLKNPIGRLMANTYVYRTSDLLLVIDPGWPWTLDALELALQETGIAAGLGAVDVILYTHTHIDHMGAAAPLERRTNARHIARTGCEAELPAWHAFLDRSNDWRPWVERAFAEPGRSIVLKGMGARRPTMVETFGPGAVERLEVVEVGASLALGDLRFEIVDIGGHDPLHMALWEPRRGWLFSGDAVLAVPTPISPPMQDDLAMYEATLSRIEALGASMMCPGHGTVVRTTQEVTRAVARSRQFVHTYRQDVRRALSGGEPLDLYSLALAMTPDHSPLTPASRWAVHMALAAAHVDALVLAGEVERLPGPRFRRFG